MIWGPHCMIEMRRNNSVSSIRNIFIKFLLSLSLMLKYRHCWPFEMNTDSELQIENTLLCYFDRCAAGCGEELLQIISIITDITNNFTSRRMTLNCVQCPRIQALKAAAAGTSLHSVVSSEDGINIYIWTPSLTGLWYPPAYYFLACQSRRTLTYRNTLMHCGMLWRGFISCFSKSMDQ